MEKKIFEGSAIIGKGWEAKKFSRWTKYGKDRIYISRDDGKKSYGYIDLIRDGALVCDDDMQYALKPFVANFFEQYRVA